MARTKKKIILTSREVLDLRIEAIDLTNKSIAIGRKENVKEVLDDLYELVNNLIDDLTLDIPNGESGAKSYEAAYKAICKHTLVVLRRKITKWKRLHNATQKKKR